MRPEGVEDFVSVHRVLGVVELVELGGGWGDHWVVSVEILYYSLFVRRLLPFRISIPNYRPGIRRDPS